MWCVLVRVCACVCLCVLVCVCVWCPSMHWGFAALSVRDVCLSLIQLKQGPRNATHTFS